MIITIRCTEKGSVGAGLVDDSSDNVRTIDTLAIDASTVLMDSVNTQNSGVLLTGRYHDDYLGNVTAQGYMKLSLNTFTLDKTASYDSLSLLCNVNYHYGNGKNKQHIYVHRVTEPIDARAGNEQLYNFDYISYAQQVLGEASFTPDDEPDIAISMSDGLGRVLFEAAQSESGIVTDEEKFQEYLKGFVFVGGEDNGSAIAGINADSAEAIKLRLYYTDQTDGGITEKLYHDFELSTSSSFSHISSSRSSDLNSLTEPHKEISSLKTNNQVFLQGGVGLMARIELPTIDRLYDISSDINLLTAKLFILPVAGTYDAQTPLPDPLVMYVADRKNNILGLLSDSDGNAISVSPTVDEEYNENTYYQFDITNYIQSELDTERNTHNGLLLSMSNYNNSVERLVVGDSRQSKYRMYVQLILLKSDF